jgi:hypothetical protein
MNKDDASCKNCHGSLTTSTQITGLQHNVAIGVKGGPNCIACHDIGGNATSPTNYLSADFRCWACHGNGSEPEF